MAISGFSTLSNIVRELYSKGVNDATYIESPLWATIPKDQASFESPIDVTIKYGSNAGASNTFSTAQSNASASSIAKFQFTRKAKYAVARIERELAISGTKAAIVDAVSFEVEGATKNAMKKLQTNLYRDNTGILGQITAGSDVTSDTITLVDPNDIWRFEVGMKVVSSAAGATARGSAGTIESVDTSAGTITLTAHWDDATSAQAGDYIIAEGDVAKNFYGLASLIPVSTPSGTFCNVDRGLDPVRLGGARLDGSSMTRREAINKAMYMNQLRGGTKNDYVWMNPLQIAQLVDELSDDVRYIDVKDATIGFEAVRVQTPTGSVDVVGDPYCPTNYAWAGPTKKTAKVRSALKAPHIFDEGGDAGQLVVYNDDAFEIRVGAYACLTIEDPLSWTVITLPSV